VSETFSVLTDHTSFCEYQRKQEFDSHFTEAACVTCDDDKEWVDVFAPFQWANTENLLPSPSSTLQFLPSPYPGDSPSVKPVPKYGMLDFQSHQTSQSPLTQEDLNFSMSTSLSPTSLDSYKYRKEDDEWSSGETSDRWSDSSSVSVTGSETSQISAPSLHQNLNSISSSDSEQEISLKIHCFEDCCTSTTTNPSISHCASPPHVLRSITKLANEEVVESPTNIKQYYIFNGQENTKANKFAEIVLPTNSQNSSDSRKILSIKVRFNLCRDNIDVFFSYMSNVFLRSTAFWW